MSSHTSSWRLAPSLLGGLAFAFFFTAGLLVSPGQASAAAPNGFTSQAYSDSNGDGTIDRLTVVINGGEALSTCTVTAGELATDWTYTGGATFGGSIASATCDTGTATITFVITGATAIVTGGGTAPTIAYDNDDADNSIANASGNLGTVGAATVTDNAAPVVVSVTPTDGSSTSRNSNVTATFSEAMNTTFAHGTEFTLDPILPNGGTWTVTWASSDTVVTLNPSVNFACSEDYTMTLATTDIDAAAGSATDLVNTGPHDGAWAFSSRGCEDAQEISTVPEKTYAVTVTAPNGGEAWSVGSVQTITWDSATAGGGVIPFVNLSYTVNGGTAVSIARHVANTGRYSWTLPDVSGNLKVVVEGTDLAIALATDSSNASFTVTGATETPATPDEEEIVEDNEEVIDDSENSSGFETGSFLQASGSSTIYYIDSDGSRRPFYNSRIFYTWADSFDEVETVSAAELAELPMGAPMVPQAGTTLVKIESVAKVYALEMDENGEVSLRWLTTEGVANALYGANWADYVIDIPVTLFTRFSTGEDVDSIGDMTVDTSLMHTRAHLSR